MGIHNNYDQLTDKERQFVDDIFSYAFTTAKLRNVKLAGNDIAERAVEGLAVAVIESRKLWP